MKISVIIATCNRSQGIERFLTAIRDAIVPDGCQLEIVVIDNNSKDDTKDVVERLIPNHNYNVRYFFHPIPGVSGARNLGIANSTGEVILFSDDDCVSDSCWISETYKLYAADENLALVGGRVELYSSEDMPETIKTSLEPDVLDNVYKIHGFLHGCNMSVRRSALEEVGSYDERLGAGTVLKSAEDTDLVYRFFKARKKIIYAPEVLVYHDHGRKSEAAVQEVRRNYKPGRGAFYVKNLLDGNWDILKILYVQLRPPLRRWVRGPNRAFYIRKYVVHIFTCLYLISGAYKYLRLYVFK